jgi:aminopeptidase N
MKQESLKTIFLRDYKATPFTVKKIDLVFQIFADNTVVKSRIEFVETEPTKARESLMLHGRELELLSVVLNDKPLSSDAYRVTPEFLEILSVPAAFVLEIENRVRPQLNTSLEGLYKSGTNLYTQCEAEGFRKITYHYDRPDVMTIFTSRLEADKSDFPVLLSNGNCVASGDLPDGRHFATWEDPFKKPCYLFALVAGRLECLRDKHVTPSGRKINLEIYATAKDIKKCDFAMKSLINSMKWDEEAFGLECDLENYMIVAVGDFNFGAMENKGLNIFNTATVLASPETATDGDFQKVEAVIGHEYFHNWTGNRVTCRDWFQLCLKEGLTVFRDQEFSSAMGSESVNRIDMVNVLRQRQFPEDAGPMAHPVRPNSFVEINNFYTATVYEKGAEICRMLNTVLGKAGFRLGMDLYFKRHDGQAVTIEDFLLAMGNANNRDLSEYLLWYTQAGTPHVSAQGEYDEREKTYTLTVTQNTLPSPGQNEKKALPLPNIMALFGQDGKEIPLQLANEKAAAGKERLFVLRGESETLVFKNVGSKPVPSLFRRFSAPIKLVDTYSRNDLLFLIAHDSDDFNRWDASESLLIKMALDLVADRKAGKQLQFPKGLIEAFDRILLDETLGQSFRAMAISVPSETFLSQFMDTVDVEGIVEARRFIMVNLAKGLEKTLWKLYAKNQQTGPYEFSVEGVGKRHLKNMALGILRYIEGPDVKKAILDQLKSANNMTDEATGLKLVARLNCAETKACLESFYKKWRQDDLVIDTWFSIQAISDHDVTYEKVCELLTHPDFTFTNPNRVRALLGPFFQNFSQFHHNSGRGYRLCADMVLRLDKINPMIAARFGRVLAQWRRMDPKRQALMKAELLRIQSEPGLSVDTGEVIAQTLK